MQDFAAWTNLSETVFLLPPTVAGADYQARIFTIGSELPFAGHPTLGAAFAWLRAGAVPKTGQIVQQCAAGLVRIKRDGQRLAFAAPAFEQSEVAETLLAQICAATGLSRGQIKAAKQLSPLNPAWIGLLLGSRAEVLTVKPDLAKLGTVQLGLIGPWASGDADFEVRAFAADVSGGEDPVTGSLNAGLSRWLIPAGLAPAAYIAAQGTALGRSGRVYVVYDGLDVWIGGESRALIEGTLTL